MDLFAINIGNAGAAAPIFTEPVQTPAPAVSSPETAPEPAVEPEFVDTEDPAEDDLPWLPEFDDLLDPDATMREAVHLPEVSRTWVLLRGLVEEARAAARKTRDLRMRKMDGDDVGQKLAGAWLDLELSVHRLKTPWEHLLAHLRNIR